MTKGMHRNKYRNIEHGKFTIPKWLSEYEESDEEGGQRIFLRSGLNGVYLDHLEKVADEDDVYECHLYDLDMKTLEKLLEGCKQNGIEMRVKAYSEYNPNNAIAIRFEKMGGGEEEEK